MPGLTRVSPIANQRHQPRSGSVDSNQAAALGEFLRSARERRGLSLQQIAQETKIPQRHLMSLEHGDLSVIPGMTYRRGEVVAYATAVGLDRAAALAQLARVSQAAAAGDGMSPTPSKSRRRQFGVGVLAIAAALGALSLGIRVWKPASTQTSGASLPVNDSPTPQSATVAQQETPTRAIAERAPALRGSPQSSQPRSDVAIAPSTRASSDLPRGPEDSLQITGKEVGQSTAAGPSSANSIQTGLVIITDPAGARVTIDGIGWGTTPVTIRNLPAGTKQIRVTKDGYAAAVRVAHITAQQRVTLTIPLRSSSTRP